MANKPGACDLRCNEAVLSAFLCNPSYQQNAHFLRMGCEMVQRGNWAFAYYLPEKLARKSLENVLSDITRKQLPTGLWFKKNAPVYSYLILRALKHAGLLEKSWEKVLRYDPFQLFRNDDSEYVFLVRRNIIGQSKPNDKRLQSRLIALVARMQQKDGSWDGVVSTTGLQIERMLDLGCDLEEPVIQKGVSWLLKQYRESVEFRRPKASWTVTMNHVFTTDDYGREFLSAQKVMPHTKLASACFGSLPMIQTGIALRILSRLGLHSDDRVVNSFSNLEQLQIKAEDIRGLAINATEGDWCAHQCRFKLEEERKRRRKKTITIA